MIMSESIHVGLLIQTRLMSLIIGTSRCCTLEKPSEELLSLFRMMGKLFIPNIIPIGRALWRTLIFFCKLFRVFSQIILTGSAGMGWGAIPPEYIVVIGIQGPAVW